ncbi:MAG: LysM peptidoglycan-binding domain-containing protein [Bacillota bacterium]
MQYRLLLLFIVFFLSISPAWAASYTVLPGDSLYKIGEKFGTTVQAIQEANGLKTTVIYPGQILTIPDGANLYTVKPGDSLYKIARRYGLSYQELMRFNGLSSERIYPGQVLRIPPAPQTVSRGGLSRSDFDLLARLIRAEAESEPHIAKVGVGAVILNRVKDSRFPNTIPGVIYQVVNGYYQFEPVANGWINRPASPDSVRAAEEALGGWDPTKGALYFYGSGATNWFVRSLPVACVLGGLTFCYAR